MSQHRTRPDAGFANGRRSSCRYCGGALPKGRRTFCGGARTTYRYTRTIPRDTVVETPGHGCIHEWCLRTQPAYARATVWERDHGVCAGCGVSCQYTGGPDRHDARPAWQADHIVPVVEGGGECGLDNLRTLCTECHKAETADLARRRASVRRAAEIRTTHDLGGEA